MPLYFANAVQVFVDPEWEHFSTWVGRELDTKRVFRYSDLMSDGWEEAVDVSYHEEPVVGRSEGYRTWINNTNRSITIQFKFIAEGMNPLQERDDVLYWEVEYPARWLDLLRQPVVNDDRLVVYSPPPLRLAVGQFYTGRAILTQCQVRWLPPFEPLTLRPHRAEVSCTFVEVNRTPGSYQLLGAARTRPATGHFAGSLRSPALNEFASATIARTV